MHFLSVHSSVASVPRYIQYSQDIHMSYPDVNMNYIKSPLFLDVSIEIAKVK